MISTEQTGRQEKSRKNTGSNTSDINKHRAGSISEVVGFTLVVALKVGVITVTSSNHYLAADLNGDNPEAQRARMSMHR